MTVYFNTLMSVGWKPTVKDIHSILSVGGGSSRITIKRTKNKESITLCNLRFLGGKDRESAHKIIREATGNIVSTVKEVETPLIWCSSLTSCREGMLQDIEMQITALTKAMEEKGYSTFPSISYSLEPRNAKVKRYIYSTLFAVRMTGFECPVLLPPETPFEKETKTKAALRKLQQHYHNKGAQKLLDEFFSGYSQNYRSWASQTNTGKRFVFSYSKPFRTLYYKDGLLRMYHRPLSLPDISLFFKLVRDFPKLVISIGRSDERVTSELLMKYLLKYLNSADLTVFSIRRNIWLLMYLTSRSWGSSTAHVKPDELLTASIRYNGPETYIKSRLFEGHPEDLRRRLWNPYKKELIKLANNLSKFATSARNTAIEYGDYEEDDAWEFMRLIYQWRLRDILSEGKRLRREEVEKALFHLQDLGYRY